MRASIKKHTLETIYVIAITCDTIIEFKTKSQSAYNAARKLGVLNIVTAHMRDGRIKWTKDKILAEAKKYNNPYAFQLGSKNAYQAAINMGILKEACTHMTRLCHEPYDKENLKPIVAKHRDIGALRSEDPDAYAAICRLGLLEELTSSLDRERHYWSDQDLFEEARKYMTHGEFKEKNKSAYTLCVERGILEEVCSHMFKSGTVSSSEYAILCAVKKFFPETKRYKTNSVKIENKSHIKGFEVDILVKSLGKAIEFDGTYYHSFKGLKRSRKHWPNEDICNYHDLKDTWFATKGIQILHIKEEEWKNDKATCIAQIEQFLGITGFMSESEQKAA